MKYSYGGYSLATFVVWGVILVIFWAHGNTTITHNLLLVFLGWVIAWVSTTIARLVYPPPKRWFNLKTQSWTAIAEREVP